VLLAGAIKTVFTEITTMQNKDGSPLVVNNYSGPVIVNHYASNASGRTKHRASAKQARHSKGHGSVKAHVPKADQPSKEVPGEQHNFCRGDSHSYATSLVIPNVVISNLAECYLDAAYAPPMPGAWRD
jgi:hypothetical protein